jgi:UDP-N-acetylglucosamine 2-epimerase (non-hydrolysing)
MPEEINRLVTDQISDLLLTPSPDADENLLAENIPQERIRLVGNVMIDSLYTQLERANYSIIRTELGLRGTDYAVVTLHRPSNVDEFNALQRILTALERISESLPVIFPVHPRTRAKLGEFGLMSRIEAIAPRLRLVEPLGYLDFLSLFSGAKLVLTDSGGVQEETTALGIPCLTLRENTERPSTITHGTNQLVGTDTEAIIAAARDATSNPLRRLPPLWDGKAADRILNELVKGV